MYSLFNTVSHLKWTINSKSSQWHGAPIRKLLQGETLALGDHFTNKEILETHKSLKNTELECICTDTCQLNNISTWE